MCKKKRAMRKWEKWDKRRNTWPLVAIMNKHLATCGHNKETLGHMCP